MELARIKEMKMELAVNILQDIRHFESMTSTEIESITLSSTTVESESVEGKLVRLYGLPEIKITI